MTHFQEEAFKAPAHTRAQIFSLAPGLAGSKVGSHAVISCPRLMALSGDAECPCPTQDGRVA